MNARERLERIERELRDVRDALADRMQKNCYIESERRLVNVECSVSEVLYDYGAELENVEVPSEATVEGELSHADLLSLADDSVPPPGLHGQP